MSENIFILSPYLIIWLNKLPKYIILGRKYFFPRILKAVLHCLSGLLWRRPCLSDSSSFVCVTFLVCLFVLWEYFYPPGSKFTVTCLGMGLCSSIQATPVWTFIFFSSGEFSPVFLVLSLKLPLLGCWSYDFLIFSSYFLPAYTLSSSLGESLTLFSTPSIEFLFLRSYFLFLFFFLREGV